MLLTIFYTSYSFLSLFTRGGALEKRASRGRFWMSSKPDLMGANGSSPIKLTR